MPFLGESIRCTSRASPIRQYEINIKINRSKCHPSPNNQALKVEHAAQKQQPGLDDVGSISMLQTPPGIEPGAAAGQHDQGGVDQQSRARGNAELPLAMFDHVAPSLLAGQTAAGFGSVAGSCTAFQQSPPGDGGASGGRGEASMHAIATPVALGAVPSVGALGDLGDSCRIGSRGGHSVGLGGCRKGELRKALQQKKVVFADSFPTDQAVRQIEERKVREEKMVENGMAAEDIKKMRKKKKLHQEEHFDDCSSDPGLFEEEPLVAALPLE